jgi:integrase/recombinase XerD
MAGRLPTLVPRDDLERRVTQVWREGGLTTGTIAVYLWSVRRIRAHWGRTGADEFGKLTHSEVVSLARSYVGPRRGRRVKHWCRESALSAMHAWSRALHRLGVAVPSWRSAAKPPRWPTLVKAYGEYRRSHRGVSDSTLLRDLRVADDFLRLLRVRGRRLVAIRVTDIDHFVDRMLSRLSRRTVADRCSSLRCFLRFLRSSGRLRRDLAACIAAPRYRVDEPPPRALPWECVRRLLRAIPRDDRLGRRDYAMLLLLATYGLGAGEVVHLRLDDIDWRGGLLRTRRPKTGVFIELPLLPPVARALADYLRRDRPRNIPVREVFTTVGLSQRPITSGVLRHQVRKYAKRAGVTAALLGAHVFRHSHATRQIDAGVPVQIVGSILGHRRPSSTLVSIRVAMRRLRTAALPVPR